MGKRNDNYIGNKELMAIMDSKIEQFKCKGNTQPPIRIFACVSDPHIKHINIPKYPFQSITNIVPLR